MGTFTLRHDVAEIELRKQLPYPCFGLSGSWSPIRHSLVQSIEQGNWGEAETYFRGLIEEGLDEAAKADGEHVESLRADLLEHCRRVHPEYLSDQGVLASGLRKVRIR